MGKKTDTIEFEANPGKILFWEFRVLADDVSYQAQADGEDLGDARKVSASEGWQTGQYIAQESCSVKIVVTFDNSHSYFREKDIEYRTFEEDLPPDLEVEQETPRTGDAS